MHVIFRETHGIEETESPVDLGQDPAELVVLSFSDSDLGAFAAGWCRAGGSLPSLRLANISALRHPISVDTYIEKTLRSAKAILVRLIGGESYWSYGVQSLNRLAHSQAIALAVLPGDGAEDPRLDALSTIPVSTLRRLVALCDAGGAIAAQAALAQLSLAGGLYAGPVSGDKGVADFGFYDPERGPVRTAVVHEDQRPKVVVPFYRSYLTAADTAPIDALIGEFRRAGFGAYGVFVPSLKATGARVWLGDMLSELEPRIIANTTAFSARDAAGRTPFDNVHCPVFQVALSSAERRQWVASDRGLSPADVAMHVVMPEVDGRIFAGAISFKSRSQRHPDLQFARMTHEPDPDRVSATVRRMLAWERLASTEPGQRRLAVVLSTYPGRDYQMAHAVGLDTVASTEALLDDLAAAGYATSRSGFSIANLGDATIQWSVAEYEAALSQIPAGLRDAIEAAWDTAENDPQCRNAAFHFHALRFGDVIVALQPERGRSETRSTDYHDLARAPRHSYVAFYLWLREAGLHALVHIGTHGTLEWTPGKSVALSAECWPEVLIGDLPVIYPFIVNDPGEAAQAKRRIGAVTIGHLPPPLAASRVGSDLQHLERLLDEFSNADGLDPPRRKRLIGTILDEARATGVYDDLDLADDRSVQDTIGRIDRFVCDIKDTQFGLGLHVLGRGAQGHAERAGLLSALAGRRIEAGPAGSPYRGRCDVLPTGRNLYAIDPRAVPSPTAYAQGIRLAEELVRKHLQDQGDWPRSLIVDLWGSATMRTAGEDFSMAMRLAGLKPTWDHGTGRVTGFELLVAAELEWPAVDVTLRVSGLFRDMFPGLAQLFQTGVDAVARRNGGSGHLRPRVFCPPPGRYGVEMSGLIGDYSTEARRLAGEAWLAASSHAIGTDGDVRDERQALEACVHRADAFVHAQDLPETDLLLAADYAVHEAGVAAAATVLGRTASSIALYHLDATAPQRPRARTLTEEIARVVRARAANPAWADGMKSHGFRGAAEIAATLDHLAAFSHLARVVPSHLFDLYFAATLDRPDVIDFMARENPAALAALRATFMGLQDTGLWSSRRNSTVAQIGSVS